MAVLASDDGEDVQPSGRSDFTNRALRAEATADELPEAAPAVEGGTRKAQPRSPTNTADIAARCRDRLSVPVIVNLLRTFSGSDMSWGLPRHPNDQTGTGATHHHRLGPVAGADTRRMAPFRPVHGGVTPM
jgi:hypothetical protein